MSKQAGSMKYRQYSPSKVASAVSVVQSGAMSKRKAALTFGIPRSTLLDKLSGKAPVGTNPGKPCVLNAAEESVLVDYVKLMASIGYPLKRKELCFEVKKVLDNDGRKTPFNENLPGKHWYRLFSKRHPDLCERSAMALGHQRSHINLEMIEGWFNGLTSYLKKEVPDVDAFLRDPRRIFNADESGFPLSVTDGKVLTEKGVRHVYQVCTSNKTQITVLACFNAMGNYVPPLIVYPGERFRDTGIHEFEEAIYGHTSSGWMDSDLFVSFLRHFNDFVEEQAIPKPVLLLVDGHSTHMSLEAGHFCYTNDIILYCLLENATHILQPCDVGFFSPMKAAWKTEVKNWQLANLGKSLTKREFPGVFKKAWVRVAKVENAIHGFQKCGLFPLNPANIDLTKLNPSKVISRMDEKGDQVKSCCSSTETGNGSKDTPVENASSGDGSINGVINMSSNISQDLTNPLDQIPVFQSAGSASTPLPGEKSERKSSCIDRPGNQTVSKSFSLLTVPEIEKKRSINTLRKKLPKALSGKDALRMLKDKEEEKKANEIAKQKRKEERLFKKAQKEEEKERKRIAREENKLKRKQKQLEKAQSKKQKYRKESNESDDSEEEAILKLVDSSEEEFEETLTCPGCNSDEGTVDEWIRCQACSRKWHITCTGDAVIFEIPTEQIEHYPFHCEFCI